MIYRYRLLITFSLFVGLVLVVSISRQSNCGEVRAKWSDAIDIFKNPGSVKEIVLYKTYPNWKINLVKDTLVVKDDSIVQTLQKLIIERKATTWGKHIETWNVTMKMRMYNGESVTWRVKRVTDKDRDIAYIYPEEDNCFNDSPDYSTSLGPYLEVITGYTGSTYK